MRLSTRILLGFMISGATAFATNVPPVVSITEPVSGFSAIGPLTVTLQATASSSDSIIASVTYHIAGSATKTVKETASPYTYKWTNVVAGSYSITAVAEDALGLTTPSSAVQITVVQDQPPIVTLSVPADASMLIGPASVPLAATASSPDGETITNVSFYNGTKKLGTSIAPYSFTWKDVAAGTYNLTAIAIDSLGTTSAPASVSVTIALDQPPGVSLTAVPALGYGTIGPTSIQLTVPPLI